MCASFCVSEESDLGGHTSVLSVVSCVRCTGPGFLAKCFGWQAYLSTSFKRAARSEQTENHKHPQQGRSLACAWRSCTHAGIALHSSSAAGACLSTGTLEPSSCLAPLDLQHRLQNARPDLSHFRVHTPHIPRVLTGQNYKTVLTQDTALTVGPDRGLTVF